jgi:hypothetical protein
MAYRTATMSRADTHLPFREPSHLIRKLLLLFLLVVAAAYGIVFLLRQKPEIPILLFTFFADASLGLIAGLGVRTIMRDQGWFVKGVAAAAIVVVGLVVLGYLTAWKAGIGPMEFGRSTVDWLGLTQMVIGIDMAWVTLRAWRHQSAQQMIEAAPRAASHPRRMRPAAAAPRVQLPRSWSLWPKPRPKVRTRSASRSRSGAQAPVLTFAKPQPVRSQRRSAGLFRRKPQVQLALVEEHRCPYCLDLVSRSDPRGTMECEVCHTLHHADCWAITGTCQVPHLNT